MYIYYLFNYYMNATVTSEYNGWLIVYVRLFSEDRIVRSPYFCPVSGKTSSLGLNTAINIIGKQI